MNTAAKIALNENIPPKKMMKTLSFDEQNDVLQAKHRIKKQVENTSDEVIQVK